MIDWWWSITQGVQQSILYLGDDNKSSNMVVNMLFWMFPSFWSSWNSAPVYVLFKNKSIFLQSDNIDFYKACLSERLDSIFYSLVFSNTIDMTIPLVFSRHASIFHETAKLVSLCSSVYLAMPNLILFTKTFCLRAKHSWKWLSNFLQGCV